MPPYPPFLHPVDAATHAPWWVLALCLAGGVGVGLLVTSGGSILRRGRDRAVASFVVRTWGLRADAWFAEVEAVGSAGPLNGGWSLETVGGAVVPLTVELVPGKPKRAGLVGTLPDGDGAGRIVFRPFTGGASLVHVFEGGVFPHIPPEAANPDEAS